MSIWSFDVDAYRLRDKVTHEARTWLGRIKLKIRLIHKQNARGYIE